MKQNLCSKMMIWGGNMVRYFGVDMNSNNHVCYGNYIGSEHCKNECPIGSNCVEFTEYNKRK